MFPRASSLATSLIRFRAVPNDIVNIELNIIRSTLQFTKYIHCVITYDNICIRVGLCVKPQNI